MRGIPITEDEIKIIKRLRETGHSLPEICVALKRRNSTIYKYIKDIIVLPEYAAILKQKQGGSIKRAERLWKNSKIKAGELLKKVEKRDKFFILAAIYWGEGAKKEFNLINSDPALIQVSLSCLREIGVSENDLRVSIRVYEGIKISEARKYWAKICNINEKRILGVNILQGKKHGKLPYGMCRIRVTKSGNSFKLIMSMIEFIKSQIIKKSS
ncbi:MAG: hypothetical protein ACD_11C00116G0041 [uncultured bacterium]|nr:MAG: hypothetical protein ACD_11C00116G0041 [uncultured bacterium]HBR71577.1 hypothetical protein [Candidatus Moranbacteria bacterium]